jgi:hypothetical protein
MPPRPDKAAVAGPGTRSTDDPYPLTPDDRAAFARDGFIRFQNFFTPADLAAARAAILPAVESAPPPPSLESDPAYAAAFTQLMNLWQDSPAVAAFAFCNRLASTAARLLGVRAVRVYHDQALFKPPGAGPTGWHADGFYWPLASVSDSDGGTGGLRDVRACTAWIPLDEDGCPPERGPLQFAAGSHSPPLASTRAAGISSGSDDAIGAEVATRGCAVVGGGFAPGEVSFHAAWTAHRADGNNASPRPRRVFTVIFVDADAVAVPAAHANHVADYERWLPGVRPGEGLAGCAKTPIVFSEEDGGGGEGGGGGGGGGPAA